MDYNYKDIKKAYKKLGVERGSTVLLKTDLRYLGAYDSLDRNEALSAHYNALSELIDFSKGTLVVSTASQKIMNTNTPFDLRKTPSERGILTQYICNEKESIRSFHPFDSYTAIGKNAKYICCDVSRHSYGPETPKARLIDMNSLCVTIGLSPRLCSSTPHHIEMVMGVPYRYTREFIHPVVRNEKLQEEPFYRFVWYRNCPIKRNKNRKIFNNFIESGHKVKKVPLGQGHIYSFSMHDFTMITIQYFKRDIYAWLDQEPESKPYLD